MIEIYVGTKVLISTFDDPAGQDQQKGWLLHFLENQWWSQKIVSCPEILPPPIPVSVWIWLFWKSIISPYVLISSVSSYHDMIYIYIIYYINNSSSISFSSFKPSMLEFLLNANSFCCQGGGLPKLLHAGSLPGSIHGNPVNTGLWTWTECKVATYAHYKWFCHIYHVKLTVSLMCWVMRRISWALGSTAVGTKDVKSCNLHQSTT